MKTWSELYNDNLQVFDDFIMNVETDEGKLSTGYEEVEATEGEG